ncbi:MAG: DUF3106 domain-containing protein [Betaproteobacteria bacterium]|nr:DUF3106 domain-containing protein [Betaproteobacteria bacterium]
MFEFIRISIYPSFHQPRSWMACILVVFSCALTCANAADALDKAEKTLNSLDTSPRWSELSEAQQKALLPLQTLWPTLDVNRKRKWLAIAQNFSDMSESSQILAQERMREWAALSPLQRSQARLNFAQAKQLSPDEKLAKWEAYQALNEEEKQKLPSSRFLLPRGSACCQTYPLLN